MKTFVFDTLLSSSDFCNIETTKDKLTDAVNKKKKMVIYGPRNYGKTSLVKNVIVPAFKKKHPKSFVLFCDVMEVKSLNALIGRLNIAFSESFKECFPGKTLMEGIKTYLTHLRPKIEFDNFTGQPSFSISHEDSHSENSFSQIFDIIKGKIAPKIPTLIIFDEFQDIAMVEQAQGLLRKEFQELKNIPIFLMGSKQHLLSDLFSKPKAPLAGFGEDIAFEPIPYEEYHQYIMERFLGAKIKMDRESSQYLQDLLNRIPENINILCDHIQTNYAAKTVDKVLIHQALLEVISNRRSRFESYLGQITEKQETILIQLAKSQPVKEPNSIVFLSKTGLSGRAISQNLIHFLNHSIVDKTSEGWIIADPFLAFFLRKYR